MNEPVGFLVGIVGRESPQGRRIFQPGKKWSVVYDDRRAAVKAQKADAVNSKPTHIYTLVDDDQEPIERRYRMVVEIDADSLDDLQEMLDDVAIRFDVDREVVPTRRVTDGGNRRCRVRIQESDAFADVIEESADG